MSSALSGSFRLLALVILVGCAPRHVEGLTPDEPAKRAPAAAPVASSTPSLRADGGPPPEAAPDASPAKEPIVETEPVPPKEPPLRDADGNVLPQTDERPTTDTPLFRAHAEALFAAIVADDPAPAMPFFFPVVAYEQVKDISKPAVDWQRRLVTAYERSIHRYHKKLGKRAEGARLIALDVPEARIQCMKPGREGNRIGYFRVLHSRLRWRDTDGGEHDLDVTSLISWRGHWYVVHLDGFK